MNYKKITFISMLVVIAMILIATLFFDFNSSIGIGAVVSILAGLFGFKTWKRFKKK